jgi:hypothetical protein
MEEEQLHRIPRTKKEEKKVTTTTNKKLQSIAQGLLFSNKEFYDTNTMRPVHSRWYSYPTSGSTKLVTAALLRLQTLTPNDKEEKEDEDETKAKKEQIIKPTLFDLYYALLEYAKSLKTSKLIKQNDHKEHKGDKKEDKKEDKESKDALRINYPILIHIELLHYWHNNNELTTNRWDHFVANAVQYAPVIFDQIVTSTFMEDIANRVITKLIKDQKIAQAVASIIVCCEKTKEHGTSAFPTCGQHFASTYLNLLSSVVKCSNHVIRESSDSHFCRIIEQCTTWLSKFGVNVSINNYWRHLRVFLLWIAPSSERSWKCYLEASRKVRSLETLLFAQTEAVDFLLKTGQSKPTQAKQSEEKETQKPRISHKKQGDLIAVAIVLSVSATKKVAWTWAIGVILNDPTIHNDGEFCVDVQIVGFQDVVLVMRDWAWREFSLGENLRVVNQRGWYDPTQGDIDDVPRLGCNESGNFDLLMSDRAPKELYQPPS